MNICCVLGECWRQDVSTSASGVSDVNTRGLLALLVSWDLSCVWYFDLRLLGLLLRRQESVGPEAGVCCGPNPVAAATVTMADER